MEAKAITGGYIGTVHSPGCPAISAKFVPLRYSFELQFEPGCLNIKIGGDKDGRGLFVFNEDVLDYCEPAGRETYREVPIEKSELVALRDFLVERFPLMPAQPDQPAQSYPVLARFTRDMALEEAAQVVDRCNRSGPYDAIGAAARIRGLIQAKACSTCFGIGREREGGRCQDCGGRGLADGEPGGLHPRAELLRLQTLATMEHRREKFAGHPSSCDGMRSGVCTCPASSR